MPRAFLAAARFSESDFRPISWLDRVSVRDAPDVAPPYPGYRQGDHFDLFGQDRATQTCGCPACSGGSPSEPQFFMQPQSGVAPNGLPIFNWDQAAAQITRESNGWAGVGNPAVVTFGFRESIAPGNMPSGATNFSQFSLAQITATIEVLALWSEVANITFTRIGEDYTNNATMLFANYNTAGDGASAFAFYPGSTASTAAAGDVWVNLAVPENMVLTEGTFGPHILAHEIGHAIGLAHPGDYDASDPGDPTYPESATYWQDSRMYTVLSYFGSAGPGGNLNAFASGPQLHDIAAAQLLYGANMTTRTGDTVYGFNSNTGHAHFTITGDEQSPVFAIWDAGGNDTLDLSGYSTAVEIDLREEAFSSAGPGSNPAINGGRAHGNMSIARGAVIENGIGGSADDLLIGNNVANTLTGNAGADTMDGGAGADTLVGGAGNDILRIHASQASTGETLNGGTNTDTLEMYGSVDFTTDTILSIEALTFLLDTGAETTLQATLLADQTSGLAFAETFTVTGSNVADRLLITATSPTVVSLATWTFNNWSAADHVTFIGATAGAFNDRYTGSNGVDIIISNGGGDFLDGRGGDDYIASAGGDSQSLIGGSGFNTLVVQRGVAISGGALSGFYRSSFTASNLAGISAIDFGAPMAIPNDISVSKVIDLSASQIDAGEVSTQLQVNGVAGHSDVIEITLTFGSINLSQWSFTNWTALSGAFDPGSEDAIFIFGADDGTGLVGTSQGEVISAAGGNDIVDAGGGNDQINGGDGNDFIDGGAGADAMAGGGGNDTYVVDDAADTVTEGASAGTDLVQASATFGLTANIENLTLTGGAAISGFGNILNNAITGNSAANQLNGFDGADTLDGGLGGDNMFGGNGDDAYIVDNTSDQTTEASALGGTDTVFASVNRNLTANIENLTLTGAADITGAGNVLNNFITGNSGANTLYGFDGADRLDGGTGADSLFGANGDDVYVVDDVNDITVEGSPAGGTDTVESGISRNLNANFENLILTGTAQFGYGNVLNNAMTGNAAANGLYGFDGNDTLDGGAGVDQMFGANGDDIYVVDNASDVTSEVSAGGGTDTVQSSVTRNLTANLENLILTGGADINGAGNVLANVITGNSGVNTLFGLDGADTLDGGLGADTLQGGLHADSYVFSSALGGGNVDAIVNYSVADDTIVLNNAVFTGLGAGTLDAGAFVIGSAAADADDRIIYNSATGQLLFDGDGDGDGAGAAILFATLTAGLALTNNDFIVSGP